jgi:uncharacterized RDD family membrane protein YckC
MIVKRGIAFLLDYVLIVCYAVVLYFISPFLTSMLPFELSPTTPIVNQVTGFITLTLPVFLYFYSFERSARASTLGKRIIGLQIQTSKVKRFSNAIF